MIDFLLSILTFPFWLVSTFFIYAFGIVFYYGIYVLCRVYIYEAHWDTIKDKVFTRTEMKTHRGPSRVYTKAEDYKTPKDYSPKHDDIEDYIN